jgi:hypothetical protein
MEPAKRLNLPRNRLRRPTKLTSAMGYASTWQGEKNISVKLDAYDLLKKEK